jgi:hypothetical protein
MDAYLVEMVLVTLSTISPSHLIHAIVISLDSS